jgi:hypothetical protein
LPPGYTDVKRFALLLTFLWWAQFPVCVLADGGGHAHGEAAQEATVAEHHHTGQDSPPPSAPEREGGPSSCAEHCASLARAMPGQAATPAPGVATLMILLPGTSFSLPAPHALELRSAPERLPPDRPLRTTILRL